jgi:transcriptional regulator with XRE-family HTH domain
MMAMTEIMVAFGQRLREVRLKVGVSQEKLAELAGLHRTYVSTVERGLKNISIVNIARLAAALDVEPADLMPPLPKKPAKSRGPAK